MWDQLLSDTNRRSSGRIIPTYVGSTFSCSPAFPFSPNHSHVCGINKIVLRTAAWICESFPRMWDQQPPIIQQITSCRIIPTYVGSTLKDISLSPLLPESFPRMWDQHQNQRVDYWHARIIPTYVGSTSFFMILSPFPSNHSHVCGINDGSAFCPNRNYESFPRMGDQPCLVLRDYSRPRIIPTYVGSTMPRKGRARTVANHSHVCGINVDGIFISNHHGESFPRMWDQRSTGSGPGPIFRIIPTYVGSTT